MKKQILILYYSLLNFYTMRTKNLFRTLVVATLATLGTFNTSAQYVPGASGHAADYDAANSDYVTIGSRMPYFVTADPAIITLQGTSEMAQSQFRWRFFESDGTTPMTTAPAVLNWNGTGATAGGAATYYVANEISVTWGAPSSAAALGHYVVEATEHGIPYGGVFADGCDDPTPSVRDIFVIDRPTIDVSATAYKACGFNLGTDHFYVPVTATGVGSWDITYSLQINAGAATTGLTDNIGTAETYADGTILTNPQIDRNLTGTPGATTDGIDITPTVYGKYTVTVTNVTDRISRKSLTAIASQAGDLPATSYVFYIVPTPNTGAIQHRNNAW
jgi:hypothetical protein